MKLIVEVEEPDNEYNLPDEVEIAFENNFYDKLYVNGKIIGMIKEFS